VREVERIRAIVPAPQQFPQLPGLGRCQPGFRQSTHPQQVGQVGGVSLIVLDPAVSKRLHPQGVGQVNLGPGLSEDVSGPVPAESCLQYQLLARTGLGDLALEPDRVVVEADHLPQLTPFRSHANQD
jgi:hypothetical protein